MYTYNVHVHFEQCARIVIRRMHINPTVCVIPYNKGENAKRDAILMLESGIIMDTTKYI